MSTAIIHVQRYSSRTEVEMCVEHPGFLSPTLFDAPTFRAKKQPDLIMSVNCSHCTQSNCLPNNGI
jgi:hypothetical protein